MTPARGERCPLRGVLSRAGREEVTRADGHLRSSPTCRKCSKAERCPLHVICCRGREERKVFVQADTSGHLQPGKMIKKKQCVRPASLQALTLDCSNRVCLAPAPTVRHSKPLAGAGSRCTQSPGPSRTRRNPSRWLSPSRNRARFPHTHPTLPDFAAVTPVCRIAVPLQTAPPTPPPLCPLGSVAVPPGCT